MGHLLPGVEMVQWVRNLLCLHFVMGKALKIVVSDLAISLFSSPALLFTTLTVTWDGFHRKRLTALPAFGTSVAALAFSHDGSALAMASSYTFEEGERDHPRDEIFVRRMLDSDCQPKSKK